MNKLKRVAAVVMVSLCFIAWGAASDVRADETVAKTADIVVSLYEGKWTMKPETINVSADLSDKYVEEIGFNDTGDEVTILDTLIAAHIKMYGEDFEQNGGTLTVSEYGWITAIFGKENPAVGYNLNGASADSLDTDVVNDDCIDLYFYGDTEGYSDMSTGFGAKDKQAKVGEEIKLTATGAGYDADWNIVQKPVAGVTVSVDGQEYGVTDANGEIALSFAKEGKYLVLMESCDAEGVYILSYCYVTVKGTVETTTVQQTTTIPSVKRVTIKSVKNSKKGKAKISLKKLSKVSGYQYKYSTSKKFKKATVKNTSKTSIYTKKIKKKKTVYVKVRAYVKANETRYYGIWSKTKKVKIKK